MNNLQIIEDTIIPSSDLEVGVYKFDLTTRVAIGFQIHKEVVKVIVNVKGKERAAVIIYYSQFLSIDCIMCT